MVADPMPNPAPRPENAACGQPEGKNVTLRVIVDTREQAPFTFNGPRYSGVAVEVGTLALGDYSLAGLEDRVAVERKSLPDLVACLGRERDRFERELARAAALDSFAVVVEASWQDLATGNYRSQMNAHAACQSVLAFTSRYGTPFLFAGSRIAAEYAAWCLLRQYIEHARKRWSAIIRAHAAHA